MNEQKIINQENELDNEQHLLIKKELRAITKEMIKKIEFKINYHKLFNYKIVIETKETVEEKHCYESLLSISSKRSDKIIPCSIIKSIVEKANEILEKNSFLVSYWLRDSQLFVRIKSRFP